MHPILRYCVDHDISQADFARRMGRSPQLINDAIKSRCRLSGDACLDAVRASGGRITLEELLTWKAPVDQPDCAA